jgi:hypothetical protein
MRPRHADGQDGGDAEQTDPGDRGDVLDGQPAPVGEEPEEGGQERVGQSRPIPLIEREVMQMTHPISSTTPTKTIGGRHSQRVFFAHA